MTTNQKKTIVSKEYKEGLYMSKVQSPGIANIKYNITTLK